MIDLHNVSKSFDGGRFVAKNLHVRVRNGELLALAGTSGSGKSTTLMMIDRLIDPTSGHIVVAGQDSRTTPATDWRRGIGYVSQKVGLYPHLTVEEHVTSIPRTLGWSARRIHSRTDTVLELVGLSPASVRQRLARELSPGTRQRVKLARALAADPKVVLFDDPFGPLDTFTRDEFLRDIGRILRSLRVTAVVATRDVTEALQLGDRVAVLREGRIVRLGTPKEFMENPEHRPVAGLLQWPRPQPAEFKAMAMNPQAGLTGPLFSPSPPNAVEDNADGHAEVFRTSGL